jgi:hypothetical protein
MPSYRVIRLGFFDGRLYDPEGKRTLLHVEKELTQVPSWLVLVDEAKSSKKDEKNNLKQAVKRATRDKKKIDESFLMGEGERASTVETL